jgi:hypothetical protein
MKDKTIKDILTDINPQRREAMVHFNEDSLRILIQKEIITETTLMRDINKALFLIATNTDYPKNREHDDGFVRKRRKKAEETVAQVPVIPHVESPLFNEEKKKEEEAQTIASLETPEQDDEEVVVIDMDEEEHIINNDGEDLEIDEEEK